MFNIFKKKPVEGEKAVFKIDGMHCSSCSMNISGALEDTHGVVEANVSYAQSEAVVSYDPGQVSVEKLQEIIETTGYKAKLSQ